MAKSMVDIAFDLLKANKQEMSFIDLWDEVSQKKGFSRAKADELIGQFYSDLTLDNRFVQRKENRWGIRSHYKFDDVVIRTDNIIIEEDEEEEEIVVVEEGEEKKEEEEQ